MAPDLHGKSQPFLMLYGYQIHLPLPYFFPGLFKFKQEFLKKLFPFGGRK
jgi:hypothetical protein